MIVSVCSYYPYCYSVSARLKHSQNTQLTQNHIQELKLVIQLSIMPTKGLRYMNKVDLDKDAATESFLHVCFLEAKIRCIRQRLTSW